MLFTCEDGKTRVSVDAQTGLENILVEKFLVTTWAFGNTLLPVDEINGKLGISDKGVPNAKEAASWTVPGSLMFPRSKTKLDFDIGRKVEVTCNRFLQSQFEQISERLRK